MWNEQQSFIYHLLNQTGQKTEAYLDLKNNLLHLGDKKNSSLANSSGEFITYESNSAHWVIKIRDVRYNSTSANYSSLNDTFTRAARVDSMFPGVAVPMTIWKNVEAYMLKSISTVDAPLNCSYTELIMNENFTYCMLPTTCSNLGNISLQFSGNETFIYPPQSYAIPLTVAGKSMCKIALYGSNDLTEDYYMLGDLFLQNYYVLLNYTSSSVGFNGYYYLAEQLVKPDPPKDEKLAIWGVMIIAAVIVGIILAVCVCLYIRQKNTALKMRLNNTYERVN